MLSKFLAAICAFSLLVATPTAGLARNGYIPAPAAADGYNVLTFNSQSFTTSNVDLNVTLASGYQWYGLSCLFAATSNLTNSISLNSDNSLTLGKLSNGINGALSSVGCTAGQPCSTCWVGTAFGGGAYFEMVGKMNPPQSICPSDGWPALWLFGLEGYANLSPWPGQGAGYTHIGEMDMMEYFGSCFGANTGEYSTAAHDWWGALMTSGGETTPTSNVSSAQENSQSAGFDFSKYHIYSVLWTPATGSTSGTLKYYVDCKSATSCTPVFTKTYSQFLPSNCQNNSTQCPPVTAGNGWFMGISDTTHYMLMLGSSSEMPMQIQYIRVWQTNASNNLTR